MPYTLAQFSAQEILTVHKNTFSSEFLFINLAIGVPIWRVQKVSTVFNKGHKSRNGADNGEKACISKRQT